MLGDNGPSLYWKYTWKYISPLCMAVLFIASVLNLFLKTPKYDAYDIETGKFLEKVLSTKNSEVLLQEKVILQRNILIGLVG